MDANQILRAYKQGERNFRQANLRGQSFVGEDLSKADFSQADIRGANFSRVNLTQTNFAGAKAGLQWQWVIVQWIIAVMMSSLSGCLTILPVWLAIPVIQTGDNLLQKLILGIAIELVMITLFVAILCQGLTVQAVSSITGAIAIAIAIIVAIAKTDAIAFAIAILFGSSIVGAVAGAGVLAIAVALTLSGVFAVLGAVAGAIAVSITFGGVFAVSIIGALFCTGVFLLLSVYMTWQAMKGDDRFAIVRQYSVRLGSLGGTQFDRATLTDANFTRASLKSCNFHDATLLRTCWRNVRQLHRARLSNTILANPAVRQLLITGNGYNKSYIGANLQGANLTGANLERANLKRADLSHATLHQANLKDANLTETLVIGTDFTAAYLTGACLEAWNIDSTTQLAGVDCQYIFWLERENHNGSRERRPHDSDRVFQPGDFEQLYNNER